VLIFTTELEGGDVNVDYDINHRIVGIEILNILGNK
jgi:uncharacterized protein YuzE